MQIRIFIQVSHELHILFEKQLIPFQTQEEALKRAKVDG